MHKNRSYPPEKKMKIDGVFYVSKFNKFVFFQLFTFTNVKWVKKIWEMADLWKFIVREKFISL